MTRRSRRRVEAALVLLAFPVATALTALLIASPAAGSRVERRLPPAVTAASSARVSLRGGEPIDTFGLADALGSRGYEVVAVQPYDNPLGGATEVVYYERSDRAAAEALRNLLGVGTIRREQVFSPGSDLTIHIGKDLNST